MSVRHRQLQQTCRQAANSMVSAQLCPDSLVLLLPADPGKITVTCTNSTQWPDDTFTVTVNGTVRDGICGGADTNSTTVTVNRKPGITLSVTQSPSNLCDNTGSVEFIYTVGLTPTGAEDSIRVTMDPPAANWVICGGPTKLTAGE
jgi:hypothetical protein